MVLLTASPIANQQPRCLRTCVFNFPTTVENMNGPFVLESLLKSLKVHYEIKGKEFNLQFFASDQAAHLSHFILALRGHVTKWHEQNPNGAHMSVKYEAQPWFPARSVLECS